MMRVKTETWRRNETRRANFLPESSSRHWNGMGGSSPAPAQPLAPLLYRTVCSHHHDSSPSSTTQRVPQRVKRLHTAVDRLQQQSSLHKFCRFLRSSANLSLCGLWRVDRPGRYRPAAQATHASTAHNARRLGDEVPNRPVSSAFFLLSALAAVLSLSPSRTHSTLLLACVREICATSNPHLPNRCTSLLKTHKREAITTEGGNAVFERNTRGKNKKNDRASSSSPRNFFGRWSWHTPPSAQTWSIT